MSITIVGVFLAALAYVAKQAGLDLHINEAELQTTATTIVTIIGLALAYIGRVRQGDITWYGRRLKSNVTIDSLPQ